MKMRNPHEQAQAGRRPFGSTVRLAALCGVLGLGPLHGCSLVTWALGESRSAGTGEAPPTPASPLATGTPAPSPVGDTRPGPGSGAAGSAGTTTSAEPATNTSATGSSPGVGGAATSTPVPGGATATSTPAPAAPVAPARANAPPPAAPGLASPPATSTTAPAAAAPAAGGPYTVQFGAFRNAASAQTVREQVAARLSALPEMAALLLSLRVVEHAGLHRVWIGSAATVAEAAALAARLRAATGREVFVTRP